MSKKASLKSRGEDAAAAYLERCGICVVERDWHCDAGVIDIIAFAQPRRVPHGAGTLRRLGLGRRSQGPCGLCLDGQPRLCTRHARR